MVSDVHLIDDWISIGQGVELDVGHQKTYRDADTVIVPDLRASLPRIRMRRSKQQDRERSYGKDKTAPR